MPANPTINRREFLELCGFSSLLALQKLNARRWNDPLSNYSTQNPDQPNILLLLLDTLSAKDMSLYGHTNDTTPWLNELASKAIVYHNHYTPGNFTSPATASLLTGTMPWTHRCFHLHGSVDDKFRSQNIFQLLSPTHATLAGSQNILANILLSQFSQNIDNLIPTERFAISGHFLADSFINDYPVALWSELLSTSWIRKTPASLFYSLLLKIDNYNNLMKDAQKFGVVYPRGIPNNYEGMTLTLEHALKATGEELSKSHSPYFAYFHYWPPHSPFNPTKEFVGIFDEQAPPTQKPDHFFTDKSSYDQLVTRRIQYNEFIANADADLGKQIKLWQKTNLLDNTILIITSDHGEMNERGIQAHSTRVLYEPIIKIPLLIMMPGQQTRIDIYENTSSIDLLPTLLSWTGQSTPVWAEGSVLPPFRNPSFEHSRSIYAMDAQLNSKWQSLKCYSAVLIKENYKFIHYNGYEGYSDQSELYDLESDPEELKDLSSELPGLASDLKRELLEKISEANQRDFR